MNTASDNTNSPGITAQDMLTIIGQLYVENSVYKKMIAELAKERDEWKKKAEDQVI